MISQAALFALSVSARLVCVALGLFSVFGAMFIGMLTPMMVGGLLGLSAAVIPVEGAKAIGRAKVVAALALAGIISLVADVVVYYTRLNIAGNYYSWGAATAYVIGLGLMFAYGLLQIRRHAV